MKYWFGILVVMAVLSAGCASTKTAEMPARDVMLRVDAAHGADAAQLEEALKARLPDWTISVREGGTSSFNTLRANEALCLAPDRVYGEQGEVISYLPATCGDVRSGGAADDIVSLYEKQASQAVSAKSLDPDKMLKIIEASTPEDPKCFSYLPLWLSDGHVFAMDSILSEAYFIACSRKIAGEGDDASMGVRYASWLNMSAAVLTSETGFVSQAFRSAITDDDPETRVFGQALEAHVEMSAEKWTQAQMTLASALNDIQVLDIDWFSEILALMTYRSLSLAPSVSEAAFEKVIRALNPKKNTDWNLMLRNAVLHKSCSLATTLPDVTPELVDACLGVIVMAFSSDMEEDKADYAHMLERAVTDKRHPYLLDTTLSWIEVFCSEADCPWFAELSRAALATPGLHDETRTFFENYKIKENK